MRILLLSMLVLTGCARLDQVQIGSIDQTQGNLRPIHVQLSETGFDAATGAELASRVAKGKTAEQLEDLRTILALVNTGPRTGNPVYDDKYAEQLLTYLMNECPNGDITGIQSIREARSYAVISGEIVGVRAYCIDQ